MRTERRRRGPTAQREHSRGGRRRVRRLTCRVILLLGVLVVLTGLAGAGHSHSSSASTTAGAPVSAVTTAALQPAAPSGGLCSVPGIGDIGGVLGFCNLGTSGLSGDLNNICQPSLPTPEPANSGIDSMISPPASSGNQPSTLYSSYGVAGQYWATTNLQCSDMTSQIGNSVASMVFDIAKSIDRVTITVYQAAAGQGILSWLTSVVDRLISALGSAIYFPYLALVVILGAIWLAWQGLIRKRATRTIEGTIWMVVACVAAIWLIGRPADFTGVGAGVSNGITQALNTAFSHLPAPNQSNCLPVSNSDPQVQPANYNFSSGNGIVAQNANELWTVLVCKPWLAGEFGTTAYSTGSAAPTPVNTYGRQLLWAQAIASNEKPTSALIQAKQSTYAGIAASLQQHDPGIYPLFQGKQWTTRLEIAFTALFAAAIAGVLVLLIAVTLIMLKLGFLLLLIAGPFFLLVGTHPGFGRVVAVRWFEMLVGVLLKQAAVALVLSVLLYAYSLIMGTSDAVLPWALKILMIALVTVAVFIYRKPFQHLFSAVGYGMIGSTERAQIDLERSRTTLRSNTLAAAAAAVPSLAAYRAARWARRNPVPAVAAGATTAGAGPEGEDGPASADGTAAGAAASPDAGRAGRAGLGLRAREAASDGNAPARAAPPLNLPPRDGAGQGAGNGAGTRGTGPAPRPAAPGRTSAAAGAPRPVSTGSGPTGNGPAGNRRAPATGAPRSSGSAADGSGSASRGPASSAPARPGWPLQPGPSPRPQPERPAASPGPATGSGPAPVPRTGGSGPWSDASTGRGRASAPARPSPPARPGPSPARPRGSGPASRPPGAASAESGEDGSAGLPLSGQDDARRPDGPGPFWLRPRRK
jgi:hypothetical protein